MPSEFSIKEIKVKTILSRSNLPISDYSANPYRGCMHACKYCYASFMNRFTGHTEPWGNYCDVKTWPRLMNPQKYDGKKIVIGSVTDPYHPLERKFRRTKRLLSELQGTIAQIDILTKSDLILQDLELLKYFPNLRVAFSINTLDETFRQDMDRAVSIKRRLVAMKTLHNHGIRTICFISPIFPGITRTQEIIAAVKSQCNGIWLENLNLRGDFKTRILTYINTQYPELIQLYQTIYLKNRNTYWAELARVLQIFCEKQDLPYSVNNDASDRPFSAAPAVVNFFYHNQIKKAPQSNQTKKR